MAANFSMSGMPSSSERTCAGWVRYAQYPSRSSTTYTAPYSNSPPSSGPTTYDFTAGLAAPAWRSSSTAARSCSLLRPALKVMRLMWKIMVFSFSVVTGKPRAPAARQPSAAATELDEVAFGVCEVRQPPFRDPGYGTGGRRMAAPSDTHWRQRDGSYRNRSHLKVAFKHDGGRASRCRLRRDSWPFPDFIDDFR